MENLIEIKGVQYISSTQIQKNWSLCKSKQWSEIQKSGIPPIMIANTFFYPFSEVDHYMNNVMTKRKYVRTKPKTVPNIVGS